VGITSVAITAFFTVSLSTEASSFTIAFRTARASPDVTELVP
jgi:hypothetical protein